MAYHSVGSPLGSTHTRPLSYRFREPVAGLGHSMADKYTHRTSEASPPSEKLWSTYTMNPPTAERGTVWERPFIPCRVPSSRHRGTDNSISQIDFPVFSSNGQLEQQRPSLFQAVISEYDGRYQHGPNHQLGGSGSFGSQPAGRGPGTYDRLVNVPAHKQSLLSSYNMDPNIYDSAVELLLSCDRAEQQQLTWEPGSRLTDRLLRPISRPVASKGIGSRRGLESYQCLWSDCGKRVAKKANAIAHLLSHLQYKPFLCNQCPQFPRFRYKQDYIRHCKNHVLFST